MKHASFDLKCRVCRFNAGDDPEGGETVFENDIWLLRQRGRGVPGWMVLQTQRHSPGITHFDEAEAANLGLMLRHVEKTLEEITGALRVYTANLGEQSNHFHYHIVPIYEKMPLDAISWKVFELHRTPSVVPDAVEVERVNQAFRAAMIANPPPVEERMKDQTYDAACGVCRHNAGEDPEGGDIVFKNNLWVVRQRGRGVPGWMVIQSQRHVAGFSSFSDEEARNFGPAFHHFQKHLEEISGAMRIYTAALNETYPHFHCHFVPVYEKMPLDAISWQVFNLHRDHSIVPDLEEVAKFTRDYREAMHLSPPPR